MHRHIQWQQRRVERSGLREVFAAKDQMSAEYRKRWRRTSGKEVVVPGQPLGRLLRMVGLTHIDAFFLDVEGSELQVLRTFDWSLPVHVFCIETQPQTSEPTRALLLEHGYVKHVPWRYADQIRHKKRRQLLLQSELFMCGASRGRQRSGHSCGRPSRSGRRPRIGRGRGLEERGDRGRGGRREVE